MGLAACRRPVGPALTASSGTPPASLAAFSGQRALDEAAALVALGPRDPGTDGAAAAARHLAGRLAQCGVAYAVDVFTNATPAGDVVFRNVLGLVGTGEPRAERPPEQLLAAVAAASRVTILVSHYDTKAGISPAFVGANDGGSSSGLLLELAQALGRTADAGRSQHPVLLAFVDGEECRVAYGPNDGLHGSRRLAGSLRGRLHARQVAGVVVLDMVGDRDLHIAIPANGTPALTSAVFASATAAGTRARFSLSPSAILDDHVPFLEAGFPAVDLIDFSYGSAPHLNDYWHTDADTMDKLSAESLDAVGRTVLWLVERLR
jgi:hypothetical protein